MLKHSFYRHMTRLRIMYFRKYGRYITSLTRLQKFLITITTLTIGYVIFVFSFYKVKLPRGVDENSYIPYEPEITSDFPTSVKEIPIIPHIIHQTYKTEDIPNYYAGFAKTFVDLNPTWQYYFWTDKAARQLIQDKHSHLLPLWDNYHDPINKADALRYVVLYEYGGVYVDLDFECLRPLDRVTYKYSCIIPTEPFEQIAFRLYQPFLINNAILMTRPKHPFFKQLIDNLIYFQMQETNTDRVGPMFVTTQYLLYNKFNASDVQKVAHAPGSTSPYIYKGRLPEDHEDAIYVPNTRYFMDSMDTHGFKETRYYWKCRDFNGLDVLQQRACIELKKRGFNRKPNEFTFTKHHWFQAYNPLARFLKYYFGWFFKVPKVNIFAIAPRSKIYNYNM
ncbi:hypothetical protein ACF0H5_021837 [Mactra antiquata]